MSSILNAKREKTLLCDIEQQGFIGFKTDFINGQSLTRFPE